MSELRIRPATAADSAVLTPLLEEIGYPTNESEVAARFARLGAHGAAIALVASQGDKVLGLVTGHLVATLHAPTEAAYLTTLVVSSAARHQGVGDRLVKAVEKWARGHGCTRVVLMTALRRAGAHQFYERLGFEHTGRRYAKAL